jgi:hypothetical protein
LPFDFQSGPRQGSAQWRPRALLGVQRHNLHPRAYGSEHGAIRKPTHAELTGLAGASVFYSGDPGWLGFHSLRFVSGTHAISACATAFQRPAASAANCRNTSRSASETRIDRSHYRRSDSNTSIPIVGGSGVLATSAASTLQASRSSALFRAGRAAGFSASRASVRSVRFQGSDTTRCGHAGLGVPGCRG